ncbi:MULTISPECIES: hypothetical protein [unclassified Crossiella]|uniref:hypothetical protein n=1 Tax=unclassified Crossiella TaxID=2620835 RepID=UPI001FFF0B3E|nr:MULTISPECIES: hypothetical protein [unclassified Crossiella]MCK2240972.1 hypothetical protein [Crossiella sp. S99.2]MCK2253884.1 hypothetical protein [Crossiella sp. S99.1]
MGRAAGFARRVVAVGTITAVLLGGISVGGASAGPAAFEEPAAAGIDFGGKLATPDPDRVWAAIDDYLRRGPRPSSWSVAGRELVFGRFRMIFQPQPAEDPLPFAPVATYRFHGPDLVVVRVSNRASARHIRAALIARAYEVDQIRSDRAANRRPDLANGLTEGILTTEGHAGTAPGRMPLSPQDIGRLMLLRAYWHELWARPDPELQAHAVGEMIALGLYDDRWYRNPWQIPDNTPRAGADAVRIRLDSIKQHFPELGGFLDGYRQRPPVDSAWFDWVHLLRERNRDLLRRGAEALIAQRRQSDAELTGKFNDTAQLPVFPLLIVGSGWAATEDYLTLNAPAHAPGQLPQIMALAPDSGTVNNLDETYLSQSAMDLQLPGAPFQPRDFARDVTDFQRSDDFGRAVGVARAWAAMPTVHATVARIEERAAAADGNSWPGGARYRVVLGSQRQVYAAALDLATGLGPQRLPQAEPRQLAGREFTDPATGHRVRFTSATTAEVHNAAGAQVTAGPLPSSVSWLLGVEVDQRGAVIVRTPPFLVDTSGRPTNQRIKGSAVVYFNASRFSRDYGPDDRVLVVGAASAGAWDVEQIARASRQPISWTARGRAVAAECAEYPRGLPTVDPRSWCAEYHSPATQPARRAELATDLSFAAGYYRRNTIPGLGAYSPEVWPRTRRSNQLPTDIAYTADNRLQVTYPDNSTEVFDKIVYSIGKAIDYPGAARDLLGEFALDPITGPAREINGLQDRSGGLRVLGAAHTTNELLGLVREDFRDTTRERVNRQAAVLPPDARTVNVSVRYHALRIAEANRTYRPPGTP